MLEFILTFYTYMGVMLGATLLSIVLIVAPLLAVWLLGWFLWEIRPSQWTNDKPWERMYD